jgi:hypothetical protein
VAASAQIANGTSLARGLKRKEFVILSEAKDDMEVQEP